MKKQDFFYEGYLTEMEVLSKKKLRSYFLQQRENLSRDRSQIASKNACSFLYERSKNFSFVLSFASLGSEINLRNLNDKLAQQNKLVLPKVEKNNLTCYLVQNITKDLQKGAFGVFEPNPAKCLPVQKKDLEIAFVPALAFDSRLHRIGYGKGFYDRFLVGFPYSLGIGFKEQKTAFDLPTNLHDQKLTELALF